jgi:hypothetical protein
MGFLEKMKVGNLGWNYKFQAKTFWTWQETTGLGLDEERVRGLLKYSQKHRKTQVYSFLFSSREGVEFLRDKNLC